MRVTVACENCDRQDTERSGDTSPAGERECYSLLERVGWFRWGVYWYCPACAVAARLAAESMSPATGGG